MILIMILYPTLFIKNTETVKYSKKHKTMELEDDF